MKTPKARSVIVSLALLSGMAVAEVSFQAQPASAAWSPPGFVRSIGMRGEAGVYPFGMDYNAFSGEIVVGDYWNYQVRRYDLAGRLLGSFFLPPATRHGQPYAVTSDPRNGEIYVTEWAEGKPTGWISHWSPSGVFIEDFQVAAIYHAWATIDGDGYLYLADSHATLHGAFRPPQIRKYDLDNGNVEVAHWGTYGTNPGDIRLAHGLDVDDQGRVYVADAFNLVVNVYSPSGQFLFDFGSQGPESQVGQFTGDLRGLAIDRDNGWVYVVDAEGAQIEKFDLDGTPLAHWGSEGSGPGQYGDGGRDLTVDADGHVWVADFGNFRFFEYSSSGALLGTYPNPAQAPAPGGFSQNRDVAVHPSTGDVWAADTWNHRFQRFAPNGAFSATWGFRNSHPPYGMDYPRGIAIDPVTGDVWVVNTRDHVIRVYRPDGTYLKTIGNGLDDNDPGSFRWPMDVEFSGGLAYVSGYYQTGVKVLDRATGAELRQVPGANNGVAVNPVNADLYVLSWSRDRVSQYSAAGSFIRSWGSTGSGNGQFQNPWDIDIVNGTVYVTDAQLKRIQAFTLDGTYLGQFGSNGTGPLQFKSPSGITHDAAGNIYVADALNDRVVVYNHSIPLPSGDGARPSATITAPANNAVLPRATAYIEGSATDNVAVGTVEVAIRDNVTNLWWDASIATWGTAKIFNLSMVIGASPTTSVTWRFGFVGVQNGRSYRVEARATDTSTNRTANPLSFRTFSIS